MSQVELLEEFSPAELKMAYCALLNKDIEEELYEIGSPLLAFCIDTDKQDALCEYIETQECGDDPYFKYICG